MTIKSSTFRKQVKEEVKGAVKLQVVIIAGEEAWLLQEARPAVMNLLIR